jgi:tetratricopeptide (TPR) repeat protein
MLKDQGDLAAARPLLERAPIYLNLRGPEHPDTADSLNSLAVLLQAQGDFAAARPLYERALAIREKVLRSEHPDTATISPPCFGTRATLQRPKPLYERALAIWEKVRGPEHPDMANCLNNLSILLWTQGGDLAAARPLYERALAMRGK